MQATDSAKWYGTIHVHVNTINLIGIRAKA